METLDGKQIITSMSSNDSKNVMPGLILFILNPVVYDGSMWREIKNSYRTNEVGFFIGVGCILSIA